MNLVDYIILFVVLLSITLIYLGLGKQRDDVHGCTGGGLTVEKGEKERSDE